MNEPAPTPAEYWENRYRENGKSWSGNVNAALEREVAGVAPGTALDIGSGEGGDALWLAHNGWVVTAVDIAPTALAIGAAAQGPDDVVTWVAADLADWTPPGSYDLVTSCFLHSFVELPREAILRRAAAAVAPEGLLLVVGHSGAPHWLTAHDDDEPHADEHHQNPGEHRHDDADLPTADDVLAALFFDNERLDRAEWTVLTNGLVERPITAPDGSVISIVDSVLKLRRTAA
ncbi:class I SAM-dependent methyltransferase [Cryobacterium sp. TMT1-3]|uniref:Class I SAM-dependent methyltransferase n=1 Tax=Cryobacterium luteum TaxID=1424661 RepID=A0A1H8IG07_9MICO|nr:MULTISPECIES: class I SAM-dependent methyltransferase [Cryobacterium]TFB95517.1 class I SAM-dependent methyltransferase [Cryobacterium luteum]TFC31334.1 class I SAM-dependent methyltransferase [Cryobacterium sp. TMT1-3]SEN67474.1 Methyltransferase domain-containing protein [Cryobacterium luteum]